MATIHTEITAYPEGLSTRDHIPFFRQLRRFFLRMQDILLSAAGLLLLWPLMLAVAVIIVIDSPGAGPVFTQTRVGENGRVFTFYKFRSMHPNAEAELESLLQYNEMSGPAFKMHNDPRVTRVGKIIRQTNIDELPQLWNVLKGDMRIVGPRPALPREVARYDDHARQRLQVRPGMTCYWQVQPYRDKLDFDQWMALDMKYIEEQSFLTDWKIIFATLRAVLQRNGI